MISAATEQVRVTRPPPRGPAFTQASSNSEHSIISEILSVIPASRWTFARIGPHNSINSLISSHRCPDESAVLSTELQCQRTKQPTGPRIAASLGTLYGYASGATLIIADEQADFGILSLFRDSELGPFTSGELRVLTLALDSLSEHLGVLRLHPRFQETPAAKKHEERKVMASFSSGMFYLLNKDFEIVLTQGCTFQSSGSLFGFADQTSDRLPAILEETIRELTTDWSEGREQSAAVARPVPFLLVRTLPMSGRDGVFMGVQIDRFRSQNSLRRVALQYRISPREIQTLALLLDGNHLEEIAAQLFITSSTVQDHINSMLGKTKSRNRSELIARILGWYSPHISHAT